MTTVTTSNLLATPEYHTEEIVLSIFNKEDVEQALSVMRELDLAYEQGTPIVTDEVYDFVFLEAFKKSFPDHSYLDEVRKDADIEGLEKVVHSRPMLSTDKAYTSLEVSNWVKRIMSTVGKHYSKEDVTVRITPKLDGLAGRHENGVLATRGDGEKGFNVSHVYKAGVIATGGELDGDGELVLSQSYFDDNLAQDFTHPRNVMVGIVKADEISEAGEKALKAGAAYFMRYSEMDGISMTLAELEEQDAPYEFFYQRLIEDASFDFPIDGFVITVDQQDIRDEMGHNSHHHRWMLALKKKGEEKQTKVESITLQTGRTGRVTPVIEIEPIFLTGAKISRVTGHNLKILSEKGIGPNAVIKIVRSGEVIPYVTEVVEPSDSVLELKCSSCGSEVAQVSDSIFECMNKNHCPAQMVNSIIHHFKTLEVKNYGKKTVEKIFESEFSVKDVYDVYCFTQEDFEKMGFGPRQSEILVEERNKIINNPQSPEKVLASFGISGLGVRASKALLDYIEFDSLVKGEVSAERIAEFENFGSISANLIVSELEKSADVIEKVMSLGIQFHQKAETTESPITGKKILFTGTMKKSGRKDMEAQAESLGAKVQKSVSKTTDILVAGEKAGSKLEKAEKLGVTVMSEDEYIDFINA